MGFGLVISLVTGVLFGLAPAWITTKPELTTMLKEESKGSMPTPLFSFRNFLVAAQITLSVIALVIAGLFIRSLRHAQQVNPGWNTQNVALFAVNLAAQGYTPERSLQYYRRSVELVRSLPGVTDATVATTVLLNGGGALRTIRPQGNDDKLRTTGQLMSYGHVLPGYFKTMGIPLVAGRDFTDADDERHPVVVVVNENLAKLAWPGENPIGKTVKAFGSENLVEVVGVVKDVTFDNIGEAPKPYIFFSIAQEGSRGSGFASLHVRTQGDAGALTPMLRKQLQTIDPALPFVNVTTIEQNIAQGLWAPRTGAKLLGAFGLLAVLLASLGVYGVMSYTVNRRAREIGIRMAIGAQASDVMVMILNRGLIIAAAGLVIGLGAAFLVARYFQNFLIGVSAGDPLTYAIIAVLLAGVALLACYIPARRATKVDPLIALRSD
jgi:predicted permease